MITAVPGPIQIIHKNGGHGCGKRGDEEYPPLILSSVFPHRHRTSLGEVRRMLREIGWGVRQAARRSGVSRDRITRWRDGVTTADPAFMAWLTELTGLHRRLSSPLARAVPRAGNRPDLDAAGVTCALIVIGWSERQLADRMGAHRTSLRRILEGQGLLPTRESRWLEALADGHRDLPRPAGVRADIQKGDRS